MVSKEKLFKWQLPQPAVAALIVLLVSLLVALPLALTLKNDPTLQQRVQQLEGPLTALQQGEPQPVIATTAATLGVFSFTGDPRWTYSLPGRSLFDPLTALFFYGGLLLSLWRIKRPAYAFALIWLIVGLIPSAVTPQAPSTVRLVGAMPVVYLMPALGLAWLWERSGQGSNQARSRLVRGLLMILFGLLFVLNFAFTVRDGFMRWPQELETRIKYQSIWQDVAYDMRDGGREGLVLADGFYRPITADTVDRILGHELAGTLGANWI